MITTEHRAKTPSAKTGLFATLRGLLPVNASGATSPTLGRLSFATACASLIAAAALLTTSAAPAVAAEPECPNEARRDEQGAPGRALPDCRAYELASAPGVEPFFESDAGEGNFTSRALGWPWALSEAAEGGDALSFLSIYSPGTNENGPFFLSSRGAQGWLTKSITPLQSTTNTGTTCFNAYPTEFSPDFSSEVLADGWHQGEKVNEFCGTDEPELVQGEPAGIQNLFLSATDGSSHQLVDPNPPGVIPRDAWFQAASRDLSHVVFSSMSQLTPDATPPIPFSPGVEPVEDLYEWSGGVLRFVTFLPNGTPVTGELANGDRAELAGGKGSEKFTHSVSADGSRVFFRAEGNLYLRENAAQEPTASGACSETEPGKACTVQIDATQDGSGPGGGGTFQWASADGSRAFFTDSASAGLTADTVSGSGANLYEFDVETDHLTDLTPVAEAGVEGLSGLSEDGSYLYFVAEGVLAANKNSNEAEGEAGQPNLYLSHAGATTFIATLDPSADDFDWSNTAIPGSVHGPELTARVSPDGAFIGFNSLRPLTGYENEGPCIEGNGEYEEGPCQEIYLYSAATDELSCASCDPTGAPPTGAVRILPPEGYLLFANPSGYIQRFVANDGRVFFNTPGALLPTDTNGLADVYEYQAGHLHLLSSGTSNFPSYFFDASTSGDDVFLMTTQKLVANDTDSGISIYDARVDGGFPEPPPTVVCETEEACHRQRQEPPAGSSSGTARFEGPEEGPNHPRRPKCRKGQIRRHSRCVRKKQHRKHRRSHHRRAGHDRGGQK